MPGCLFPEKGGTRFPAPNCKHLRRGSKFLSEFAWIRFTSDHKALDAWKPSRAFHSSIRFSDKNTPKKTAQSLLRLSSASPGTRVTSLATSFGFPRCRAAYARAPSRVCSYSGYPKIKTSLTVDNCDSFQRHRVQKTYTLCPQYTGRTSYCQQSQVCTNGTQMARAWSKDFSGSCDTQTYTTFIHVPLQATFCPQSCPFWHPPRLAIQELPSLQHLPLADLRVLTLATAQWYKKLCYLSSFSLSAFCSVSMVAARKEVALPAGAQRFRSLWSLHCETYFGEQVRTCTRDRRSYSQDAQGSSQFQKRGTIRNRLKTWNDSTDCHGDPDIPRPPRSDTTHPL